MINLVYTATHADGSLWLKLDTESLGVKCTYEVPIRESTLFILREWVMSDTTDMQKRVTVDDELRVAMEASYIDVAVSVSRWVARVYRDAVIVNWDDSHCFRTHDGSLHVSMRPPRHRT